MGNPTLCSVDMRLFLNKHYQLVEIKCISSWDEHAYLKKASNNYAANKLVIGTSL
jgi:hypothetical protein